MSKIYKATTMTFSKQSLHANYILFFCAGTIVAPWAAIAPVIKEAFNLGAEAFALMSMFFGVGALVSMLLSGKIIKHWAFKHCALINMILCALAVFLLSARFLPWYFVYFSALLWGITLGIYEVAINIHATYFEALTKRRLLTRFTVAYTAGCLVSTLIYPLLMHLGLSIELIALFSSLASVLLFLSVFKHTLDLNGEEDGNSEKEETSSSAKDLSRILILCASAVTFFSLLAEGSVYDWGGVYLVHDCALPLSFAALGFMCYEGCAGVVRFFGEKIVAKIGTVRTVVVGSLVACVALWLAGSISYAPIALLSFAILGMAAGNIMPVIISETARRCHKNKGQIIGFVSAMGYAGVLSGPAFLGLIATFYGYAAIFIVVSLLMIIMGLAGLIFLKSEKA